MKSASINLVKRLVLLALALTMALATTCQFLNVSYTAEALTYTIPNGTYWIINAHSGKALTVYNSGTTEGTNIVQSDNVDGTNQRWNITTNYNPNYSNQQFTMLIASGTPGLCLSTAISSLSNGVNVELGTTTEENSYWDIVKLGTNDNYRIVSKCNPSYAVTVQNASCNNNANILCYQYSVGSWCNDEWIFVPVAGSPLETVTIAVQMDSALRSEYSSNFREVEAIFSDAAKPFYRMWHIQLSPAFYDISLMEADECSLDYDVGCLEDLCGKNLICHNLNSEPNHHKNFDFNALRAWDAYGRDENNLRIILTGFQMCHLDGVVHSLGALGWWPNGRNGMVEINNYNRTYTENVRVIQHELSHAFGCEHCDNEDCIMNSGYDQSPYYNYSSIWCTECEAVFDRFAY